MLLNFLMTKLAEEHYPKVNVKKCISFYNMSPGCGKCKSLCPKQSISFGVEKIRFDETTCNNCGICKAVCPTKAISIKNFGEENIFGLIQENDKIVFSCSTKSGLGNIKLKCLNGIHGELLTALLILLNEKTISFNLSKCKGCDIAKGECKQFLLTLKNSETFLRAIGFKPKYEILIDEESLTPPSEKTISRREVFSLLRKESTNIAAKTASTISGSTADNMPIREILIKAIRENQHLFNLESSSQVRDRELPFMKFWDITDKCDGCGSCQFFCPEGAWKVTKDDKQNIEICHNSGKCTGCNICIKICSKKAIIPGEISIDSLINYEEKDFKKV